MINIYSLKEKDVGRNVIYTDNIGDKEHGRIKSWNNKWIFVVYHCAGEWDNFENYTVAATEPGDLEFNE